MENKEKKPGMAVLIALKKMGKDKGDESDLSVDAAREILDAIKADDEEKLASLLKDFVHACSDVPEDDVEEE